MYYNELKCQDKYKKIKLKLKSKNARFANITNIVHLLKNCINISVQIESGKSYLTDQKFLKFYIEALDLGASWIHGSNLRNPIYRVRCFDK